jgi:signal transduction histidine kinase
MRIRTRSGTVGCMKRLTSLRGAARQHPYATDALLAAALAVSAQLELWTNPEMIPRGVLAPCSLLMTVPLAWRRRAPLAAVAVVMAAGAAQALLTDAVPAPLSPLVGTTIALYSVAAHAGLRRALAGGAITLASAWIGISREHGSTVADYVYITLLCAGVWLGGRALRGWRLRAAALEDRTVVLEREREEKARAAVAEERVRIARELHDVIAHCVSLIVVQAGAERRVLRDGQASTNEVLLSIEQTGRQALAEMRRLVEMLDQRDETLGLAPQPSVEQLGQLVEQVRDAGLLVELRVEGEPRPLAPGVDLSAYRIVQEGLTNALKHAGAARALVMVRYGPDEIEINVADDGRGTASTDGGGHGLVGMRERAALFGGTLQAGPRTEGGYALHATLPLGPGRP